MRSIKRTLVALSCACVTATLQTTATAGTWQTPGQIQQPTGPWQQPGNIQVPKGIQAVHTSSAQCTQRISVVADALFDFNKADLRADAGDTLGVAGPQIARASGHKITIEGYTDSIGSDSYNNALSEARARTVRDWLAGHGFVAASTTIRGYGKRMPVAPNAMPDGRDNPEGRQKNRRVDIAIDTCG